jgi:hypothetical protein
MKCWDSGLNAPGSRTKSGNFIKSGYEIYWDSGLNAPGSRTKSIQIVLNPKTLNPVQQPLVVYQP